MNNITEVDQERSDMIDREDDELSLSQLFLALLCPIIVIIFSYFLRLELISKIVVSVSRTIIQLYIAGYLLLGFIFATKSAVVVSSYLCLMLLIAALEVVSRVAKTYRGHFFDGLLCVSFGGKRSASNKTDCDTSI
jgi:ABC-type iron transport system FetAB permease component